MQLLILIIRKKDHMNQILARLMEENIRGGSVLECEGALQALDDSGIAPPVFSSLREYLNPDHKNKMLLSAMSDENIEKAHKIVNEVTGGLEKANVGVFITVPIGVAYGLR